MNGDWVFIVREVAKLTNLTDQHINLSMYYTPPWAMNYRVH